MTAHIEVDTDTGLVHTVLGTAANVNNVTQEHALVHGKETNVFADSGYQSAEKREEPQDIDVDWHVAMHKGKGKVFDKSTPKGVIMGRLEMAGIGAIGVGFLKVVIR